MQPRAPFKTLFLPDDAATTVIGQWLAGQVRPGDTLLLSGPVGAGKTHLARAFIHQATGSLQDVPSPSFTLVQTYETAAGEIWHADLYRLSHPDEVLELGLADAFGRAICLVEWPDRLGDLTPPEALHLSLSAQDEGRLATFTGAGDWPQRLAGAPDV